MDCRHIPKDQVLEALTSGKVNSKKSNPRSQPCPKYVVDASIGSNNKNVQAVFSACPTFTNVVTVIDKDTNWECVCP
ncbi:hypothetical protein WJX74_000201 [Apatococcus lobatus]|uniref:Uncharacterized protein n=1 Tax=Apatococcus lobatus TaxID=904363 RepID=A0AAW1S990_9CHLO